MCIEFCFAAWPTANRVTCHFAVGGPMGSCRPLMPLLLLRLALAALLALLALAAALLLQRHGWCGKKNNFKSAFGFVGCFGFEAACEFDLQNFVSPWLNAIVDPACPAELMISLSGPRNYGLVAGLVTVQDLSRIRRSRLAYH